MSQKVLSFYWEGKMVVIHKGNDYQKGNFQSRKALILSEKFCIENVFL